MLRLSLIFLIKTVIDFYVMMLILRHWMQWARCDLYNPFSLFIDKILKPIIDPIQKIISSRFGPFDSASLFLTFFISVIKYPIIISLIERKILFHFKFIYIFVGFLVILKLIGEVIFWIISLRSLLSWTYSEYNQINIILYQLSEPLIHLVRKFFPINSYNIDFSSVLIILILYFLKYLGVNLFPNIWKFI